MKLAAKRDGGFFFGCGTDMCKLCNVNVLGQSGFNLVPWRSAWETCLLLAVSLNHMDIISSICVSLLFSCRAFGSGQIKVTCSLQLAASQRSAADGRVAVSLFLQVAFGPSSRKPHHTSRSPAGTRINFIGVYAALWSRRRATRQRKSRTPCWRALNQFGRQKPLRTTRQTGGTNSWLLLKRLCACRLLLD